MAARYEVGARAQPETPASLSYTIGALSRSNLLFWIESLAAPHKSHKLADE